MRIEKLSLDFFGRFTQKVFDFGEAGRPSDFHVIYGPNEAGKTTTMEGFLRLLYGFPHIEPYDFQHQRKNLSVSGVLDLKGEKKVVTRLSARNDNLRGEAGDSLPESSISAHLNDLSLGDYRNLLCLDDETIEKGGNDIVNANGEIGRLLFSAAAGVSDLSAVLDQARDEASNLYRKGTSKTALANLKRELAATESQLREMDISARAWRTIKAELRKAEDEEAKKKKACDDLRIQQEMTGALRRVLPCLVEHDELVKGIAAYAEFPQRLDINPEDLVALKTGHGKTEADIDRLTEEIEQAEAERGGIALDQDCLDLAKDLDALDELCSRIKPAAIDLPRRRRELEDAETKMMQIARDLGAPENTELSRLVIPLPEIAALEKIRDAMREAESARKAEAQEAENLEAQASVTRKAHADLKQKAPSQTGVLDILSRFDVDTLAPAAAAARQAIAASDEHLAEAIGVLCVNGGVFTSVPACPIDLTTVKEIETQHSKLMDQIAREEENLARYSDDVEVKKAEIASLSAGVGVAGDDEARQAREERDAFWQAHRASLTEESAEIFEPSMKRVDDIDGSRLAHARELGQLRQLEQARAEAQTRKTTTTSKIDGLRAKSDRIEERVEEVTKAVGLSKMSPAALRDWVERRDAAAVAERKWRRLTEHHRSTLEQAGRLHDALRNILSLEDPAFDAALAAARRLADDERSQNETLKSSEEKCASLEDQLEGRRAHLAALDAASKDASDAWAAKVEELFGSLLTPDSLENALVLLRDIREHEVKRLSVERQVSSMESDQRQFSEAMKTLGAKHELGDGDPLDVFRRLRGLAEKAATDKAHHATVCASIVERTEKRRAAEILLEDIDRQVREHGAHFPETADTSTLDALRITVGEARDVIEKRRRIADLEQRILTELSAPGMDEARALLDGATLPILEARCGSLKADLERAETYHSAATAVRANAQRDLEAVKGGAESAELTERRTTLHLQIEETALEYLEKSLGLRLADEAIRRYRDKHRSGMMEATERAFTELTNGAYQRLRTQPGGESEILMAIDANGAAKQVGDMSKGTRFQLYLALRAAAYEQMVSQGIRLPFFCDDVFETFDEERTRAACRLMERIGRSGQAIYLTHHRHVVDIAREVCDVRPVIHKI